MLRSQNGWEAHADRDEIGVEPLVVLGVSFPGGVRAGAVATILGYVAEQMHRRVEPMVVGWCWGYAYREIVGSTIYSNHASGTAIDYNAPNHGRGARGTFTAAQVREIRKILAEVGNVVRWGGDYSGSSVDEMHFEINAGGKAVQAAADRLTQQGAGVLADLTEQQQQLIFTAAQRTMGITHQNYYAKQKDGKYVIDGYGQRAVYSERDRVPTGTTAVAVTIPDRADTGHLALRIGQARDQIDQLTSLTNSLRTAAVEQNKTIGEQNKAITAMVSNMSGLIRAVTAIQESVERLAEQQERPGGAGS